MIPRKGDALYDLPISEVEWVRFVCSGCGNATGVKVRLTAPAPFSYHCWCGAMMEIDPARDMEAK